MKRLSFSLILLFFITLTSIFFYQVFLQNKIPIAADTIVGLYHPFRDFYAANYPNGIPFKNFLITDPVRQQYPWRFLALSQWKNLLFPIWNPYSGAGMPLLANFQTAAFYPLNLFFLLLPFIYSWTALVILQVLLSGIFMYFYLKNLRLEVHAAILGAIVFSLCGFSISWLTWNTVGHVVLWLPLILLAKDNILAKRPFRWFIILIFAESSCFFAGHLQTFFYIFLVSNLYLFARILQVSWIKNSVKKTAQSVVKAYLPFLLVGAIVVVITAVQWLPTIFYLPLTARSIDQANWRIDGWFIPWQNLIQFLAPDFFGNPATLNYWGVWNYGEFIGYIGILPLLMAVFALLFRRDKKTAFFGTLFFLALAFSLPTLLARLPYLFSFPLISSSQPTRLLSLIDFSLATLSALGFDMFIKRRRGVLYPIFFFSACFIAIWLVALVLFTFFGMTTDQAMIALNNLKLPTIIFAISLFFLSLSIFIKGKKYHTAIVIILIIISILDLLRFGWKFTPFTSTDYLFPQTKSLAFLEKDKSVFRVMTTDNRLLPPNFSIMYRIESVDLYDPLYLRRYAEFIAAIERGEPNINPPFGFNRIITPHVLTTPFINLLNVKYILSFSDISSPRFRKVFSEGSTMIFENMDLLPRAFFVKKTIFATNSKDAIKKLFINSEELENVAVVEGDSINASEYSVGNVSIQSYTPSKVVLKTQNSGQGFLVFTDSFFPSWKVTINSVSQTRRGSIYQTDFNFIGIILPPGESIVTLSHGLL